MFAGTFAPKGWAFCNGQSLVIAEHDALFQLIGTTYGGDGQETFALPDLRGRLPVHQGASASGSTYVLAEMAGVEEVTLTTQQIPVHQHAALASEAAASQTSPAGNVTGEGVKRIYSDPFALSAMAAGAIGPAGASQPHTNMQPYLCVNFIISLAGIFPTQS